MLETRKLLLYNQLAATPLEVFRIPLGRCRELKPLPPLLIVVLNVAPPSWSLEFFFGDFSWEGGGSLPQNSSELS